MGELADAVAKFGGHSADPNAEENRGEEFQAGFKIGRARGPEWNNLSVIDAEWYKRDRPTGVPGSPFAEWKRGYWAGVFTGVDEHEAIQAQLAGHDAPETFEDRIKKLF